MDDEVQALEALASGTDTPITDESPVNQETPDAGQAAETTETQPETKEDNRDFRAAFEKTRQELKEAKEQLKGFQAPETKVETPESGDDEGLSILKNLMREVMREEIAPIAGDLTARQEEQFLAEFEKKPYVQELTPEINAEFARLSKESPNASRPELLERAREKAIVNNLDVILKVGKDFATEQAYNNQATKRGQTGIGERPSSATKTTPDIMEKFMSGNYDTAWYMENRAELDRLEREQIT